MKLSVTRVVVWSLVALALLVLFLPLFLTVVEAGGAVLGSILFGWFLFLKRVLPAVTFSWSGIGMVALCSVLILGGIHSFCGWLFRHAATKWNKGAVMKWNWSWTASLYVAVWMLFAAIMGAVGMAHQVGWLLRSDEPIFKRRELAAIRRHYLREAAVNLSLAAEESNWNLDSTRRIFFKSKTIGVSRPNVIEDLHVILMSGTKGDLAGGVIFYRDPAMQAKTGFALVSPGVEGELKPMKELPAVLSRYQSQSESKAK